MGTTQNVYRDAGQATVLALPDEVQDFLNLGFQGALITTILGSITWQLVADQFPVGFLSTPITYILLRICLFLEGTGICNGAWVLAGIHKSIAGFQRDEVYIGTAEERKARGMKDNSKREIDMPALTGFGGVNLPGFKNAPKSLRDLAEADPAVKDYMNTVAADMNKGPSNSGGSASAAPATYGGGDEDEVEAH